LTYKACVGNNTVVKRFRRGALVAVVWLTAAGIVVGSTPYPVCACPDIGDSATASCTRCQVAADEPEAVASPKPKAPACSCCQDTDSCQVKPDQKAANPEQTRASKPTDTGREVVAPRCVKELARAQVFATGTGPATLHKDVTPSPSFSIEVGAGFTAGPTCFAASPEVGASHSLADVLILCHRLLI
jgi:hypothetical protein